MSILREARPHELPAIPMLLARKGIYEVDDHWARVFVKECIVPPERQNIGQIMRDMGITVYDEFAMLEWQDGKCCQDNFEMVELEDGVEPTFDWWYDILLERRKKYGR